MEESLAVLMDKHIKKNVQGLDEKQCAECLRQEKQVHDLFLSYLVLGDECASMEENAFLGELRGFLSEYGEVYPQIKEFVHLN
jgi:hypothetical protein